MCYGKSAGAVVTVMSMALTSVVVTVLVFVQHMAACQNRV